MRKAKRGGGDLTTNFCKNRKACKTEWISGRLRDGDSSQDVCTKLPDWGKSVVSISLCNGDITLFSCSGMAIGHNGYRRTRFLTSASLVRAFHGKTNEHYFDLKIEVRREGKEVYRGFLAEYDLVYNFAVVEVGGFHDVNVGTFHRKLKSVPHGEACVVGRDVSGDLTAKSVELGGDLRVHKDDKDLDSKTSKAWEGATIFSFDGEVVGMNLFLVTERAVFLPWGTILKCLERYWTFWEKERGLARSTSLVHGFGAPVDGKSNSHPEGYRDCLNQEHLDIDDSGYPKLPSTMLDAGMILVNTFEEPFGDIHGKGGNKHDKGVWTKLGGKAFSRINRSVVALASFNGEKRNFACTGFFIGWNGSTKILTSASLIRNSVDENNIVENLRIEVLLPSSTEIINGTLEHYDLHYNVALVSVKNRHNLRPANTLPSWSMCSDVAAVGRCFKSHALMAMNGKLISSTSALDCCLLIHSSCKITKLGIGGPLVTLDGDVVGMNFYDKKIGTPFLLWPDIAEILASFEKRSKTGEIFNDISGVPLWKLDGDHSNRFNRWPVPMPCWRCPDYVDEDKFDANDREYCYVKGVKFRLL
ncbi:uncharacterized protein LOC8065330 isoform X1 [Sorghum bicolor]|uniref:Uncharacterized protein n=1 Tax=Sorghum bicolor TaxID=4558 RepID=A0A1B6PAS1_SORBI|nr:uncharacterized protein LOC8065330 isoform X1 [Sorghum bicolor]KXG22707.1 hypothetical protein SORBI_3009G256900 [Sorghum bicolor]|eukprot:XP_021303479.1 uncharacterized protein LOC8065330 isoform X1 [Sorghum bicolor]